MPKLLQPPSRGTQSASASNEPRLRINAAVLPVRKTIVNQPLARWPDLAAVSRIPTLSLYDHNGPGIWLNFQDLARREGAARTLRPIGRKCRLRTQANFAQTHRR